MADHTDVWDNSGDHLVLALSKDDGTVRLTESDCDPEGVRKYLLEIGGAIKRLSPEHVISNPDVPEDESRRDCGFRRDCWFLIIAVKFRNQ